MKHNSILFKSFSSLPIDKNVLEMFKILIGSLTIGFLAQLSLPVPFSPVPITGQTIGVVLVGSLLGSKKGALCILLYLMEGGLGLPVFANMSAGAHVLIGPTGGYLWGFIIGAMIMGYSKEKNLISSFLNCFLACLVSTTTIILIGTFYLSFFVGDINKALVLGLYPFLVGDVVKSFICAAIIQGSRRVFS